jgi:DNA-binding cell septation regulator SpoVG
MEVTSVSFNYLRNRPSSEKVKAYAKVILDKELIITGIKVIVTDSKRFIVFPEEKINPNKTRGEHVVVSLVNPITSRLREHITNAVFEKFDIDEFNPVNKVANELTTDNDDNQVTSYLSIDAAGDVGETVNTVATNANCETEQYQTIGVCAKFM